MLGQLGQTTDAVGHYRRAVELKPDLFDAQYHLGATLWWTRDFRGARPALEAAARLKPAHAEARYYLGLTLRELGEPAGGADELAPRGGRAPPALALAHLQLGVTLQQLGDLDGAVASLRRAVALDPRHWSTRGTPSGSP